MGSKVRVWLSPFLYKQPRLELKGEEGKCRSTIVLGATGSGKTTWAQSQAEKSLRVIAVNGEFKGSPGQIIKAEYSQLLSLLSPGTLVIIDDCIRPDNSQIEIVRKLMLYEKRHNDIDVLLLIHSITRNGTYELLAHADQFIITKSPQNNLTFQEFRRALKLNPEECSIIWKDFLSRSEKYLYLRYDTREGAFSIEEIKQDEEKEEIEKRRRRVLNILKAKQCNFTLAMELFDYISANFEMNNLNPKDLSLKVNCSGVEKRFNLVDMLFYISSQDTLPTPESVALFKALEEKFCIPTLFIESANFKLLLEKTKRKIK